MGGDHVAAAGAVRRVAHHGQMRQLLHHGNGGDVHGVAGGGFVGADAALAEDDFVVAAGEDVFAGEQQFFDGGGHAALEQDRLAHLAEFAQQVEVLHVARAHLEQVDIRKHRLDLRDLHDFADDEQAVGFGGFAHQLRARECPCPGRNRASCAA